MYSWYHVYFKEKIKHWKFLVFFLNKHKKYDSFFYSNVVSWLFDQAAHYVESLRLYLFFIFSKYTNPAFV